MELLHIIVLLISTVTLIRATPPSTLRHVNVLYRHGDRSPVTVYPKDINTEDIWEGGLGWLSNIGKQQQYELGKWMRQHYGGFIDVTHYDNTQIKIQASAVPRCLMSAYSHLAGLFPPQGDMIWNKDLQWQPIPVTSVPMDKDNKLAIQAHCPRYDKLLEEVYATDKVKNYQIQNKDFFKMVSNYSGWVETLDNLWKVTDALVCEQAHNITWNDWACKAGVFDKMKQITEFGWDMLYSTPEMAKLKGGPLLKEMIENMNEAVAHKDSPLKFHMYSAHDTTVAALLQAMNVFNYQQPPYRTLIMVELHSISNQDVVKVFLRNDTTRDPYYLIPPGCENPCKLSTFESVLHDRIPSDWDKECADTDTSSSMGWSAASWIALALGCGLVLVIIIAIALSLRNRSGQGYSRV